MLQITQKGEYKNINLKDFQFNAEEQFVSSQAEGYESTGQYGKFLIKKISYNNEDCSIIIGEGKKTHIFNVDLLTIIKSLPEGTNFSITKTEAKTKAGRSFNKWIVKVDGQEYKDNSPQQSGGISLNIKSENLVLTTQESKIVEAILVYKQQNGNKQINYDDVATYFGGIDRNRVEQILQTKVN